MNNFIFLNVASREVCEVNNAAFDKYVHFADEKVILVKDVLIRKLLYKEELSKFRR